MTELGARLKEARIKKGYTLEDLHRLTKIRREYLQYLEEGDYGSLPGTFYARAYIRQYAEAVGLDGKELLNEYEEEVPAIPQNQTPRLPAAGSPPRFSGRFGHLLPQLLVPLFILLALVVVWVSLQTREEQQRAEEPETTGVKYEAPQISEQPSETLSEEEASLPEEPDSETGGQAGEKQEEEKEKQLPEKKTAPSLKVEGTAGETTTYSWNGSGSRQLTIETTGTSWVSVTDQDGRERMTPPREMQPGEKEQLDVSDAAQVRIRLGAAPSAAVSVNGEQVAYAQELTTQNLIIRFAPAE